MATICIISRHKSRHLDRSFLLRIATDQCATCTTRWMASHDSCELRYLLVIPSSSLYNVADQRRPRSLLTVPHCLYSIPGHRQTASVRHVLLISGYCYTNHQHPSLSAVAPTMAGPKRAAFAEESAEVEVLYANLTKMKSLTKKIQSSMSRLETSGKTVQDAIGPIYGNTQRLQTTNTNIDRVIMAIDRIREPLDMRNREEQLLRSTPQAVGLTEYIASVDRTRQALGDLKQSNIRSNQQAISELSNLLSVGSQQLENIFQSTLRDGVAPVEPLHFITKNIDFPRISASKTTNLRTINAHASSSSDLAQGDAKSTPTAKIYADVRGQYITSSLQNMAAACLATARKQNSTSTTVYKRGDNTIAMYAAGIKGMFIAEYDSICPIFDRNDWGRVLSMTCQSSLKAFAATLKDLDRHVRDNITSDCFLAYEIIEVVSTTALDVESKTGHLKVEIADALKPIRETAKSSLSSLLTDIRNRVQQMQLSADGTAVPLTSEVMTRLQTMADFLVPLSSILTSLGKGGWSAPGPASSSSSIPTLKSFDVGADGRKLFADYAADTIHTLLSNLEIRSQALQKGKGVQGVFLANNVAIIERMIRSSELAPLLEPAQSKIEAWRVKATKHYMTTWNDVSGYLLDVQYTNRGPRPPSTGASVDSTAFVKALSSKEKDTMKEKFRGFNASFDEMVAKHKTYKMEKEVKTALAREVQRFIEPLYGRHWDRYHEIDKGKGKYVKYDKTQLNAVLTNLG
jgi:exocyst complex protein 7